MTTPLEDRIIGMIRHSGPMPIDRYMDLCLTDPEHGYYRGGNPLGRGGDFTTAPEISQMFGELIGLWLYDEASRQGVAGTAMLYEFGPGRGVLMADALRAIAAIDGGRVWDVHLSEINPHLIEAQRARLGGLANARPHWVEAGAPLPPAPLLVIANEFFDALPIRQFKSRGGLWYECVVDVEGGVLTRGMADAPAPATIAAALPPPEGDGLTAEICPAMERVITPMAQHISRYGGAMLVVDYGTTHELGGGASGGGAQKSGISGDSLQAAQAHAPVDILHEPGMTDLSAWVDFTALAAHAEAAGLTAHGPTEQGVFLKELGLYHRAECLAAGADAATRRCLAAAVDRLASPAHMGRVFKVMALRPRHATPRNTTPGHAPPRHAPSPNPKPVA